MSVVEAATGCPEQPSGPVGVGAADPAPFVRQRGGHNELILTVRGARCAGCLAKIEGGVRALPGVEEARLNLSNGRLRIAWSGPLPAQRIAQTLEDLGYDAAAFDPSSGDEATAREERRLLTAMGVAGFAAANVMLLSISVWAGAGEMGAQTRTLLHWISGAIAIPAVAFAGRVFFQSAWGALRKGRANMDVPISLAVSLATGFSVYETAMGGEHAYFDASVTLLFFLLIGRYLDARLRRRAHAAANDLAALQGRTATRLSESGQTKTIAAGEIEPDDLLLIAAGERVAADLVALDDGLVDESLVSGESAPRRVAAGETIYAGSVNLGGPFKGRALASADDSLVADIARMLEAGEQRRSAYRRIADKAVSIYVPTVHSVAALAFIGWLASGAPLHQAVFIAVSTLIITCPCALALAAPVVQIVAAGRLFQRGIYLKSGDALERLATADHVVFDKTGTLTLGAPRLIVDDVSQDTLAQAAKLARASRHPLSRAIAFAAGDGPVAASVKETPGLGLEAELDGATARLGSAAWVGAPSQADASLWFRLAEAAPVPLRFEDHLRGEAVAALERLSRLGMHFEIVSGDRRNRVAEIAAALGGADWTAEASPTDKTARLEALRAEGKRTLMVGDGLNDAGALSLAHASLAPGGAMDVSQSASDAVYSKGLENVAATIEAARCARRRMLENFGFAALYNMIAVPIAVAGFVTPLVAAIAMSGSSILVTLNALRPSAGSPK
ncbi:MAG: heavy metal translocating P-type ATPase [Pseudomonadota bacterium]